MSEGPKILSPGSATPTMPHGSPPSPSGYHGHGQRRAAPPGPPAAQAEELVTGSPRAMRGSCQTWATTSSRASRPTSPSSGVEEYRAVAKDWSSRASATKATAHPHPLLAIRRRLVVPPLRLSCMVCSSEKVVVIGPRSRAPLPVSASRR